MPSVIEQRPATAALPNTPVTAKHTLQFITAQKLKKSTSELSLSSTIKQLVKGIVALYFDLSCVLQFARVRHSSQLVSWTLMSYTNTSMSPKLETA